MCLPEAFKSLRRDRQTDTTDARGSILFQMIKLGLDFALSSTTGLNWRVAILIVGTLRHGLEDEFSNEDTQGHPEKKWGVSCISFQEILYT